MKTIYLFAALFFFTACSLNARSLNGKNTSDASPLEGRWDLTLTMDGKELPSWLEVHHSGTHTLVGRYVGPGGSARPISKVNFDGTTFDFTIPPQWDRGPNDLIFKGTLENDKVSGTMISSEGKTFTWTGVRAPSLKRDKPVVWGTPIKLYNGKNLDGWHAMGTNQWKSVNGVLTSEHSGANLVTDRTFNDFKLHIEFRYSKGSNSGVYLRGRYEVQIEDSKGKEPEVDYLGAIYGFIAPSEMVAKDPGAWQVYDVTLVGRMVTLVANGKTVICNREIPGITGGAINSKEGEPGPLLIQGDHGPIDFRNIIITPAK